MGSLHRPGWRWWGGRWCRGSIWPQTHLGVVLNPHLILCLVAFCLIIVIRVGGCRGRIMSQGLKWLYGHQLIGAYILLVFTVTILEEGRMLVVLRWSLVLHQIYNRELKQMMEWVPLNLLSFLIPCFSTWKIKTYWGNKCLLNGHLIYSYNCPYHRNE